MTISNSGELLGPSWTAASAAIHVLLDVMRPDIILIYFDSTCKRYGEAVSKNPVKINRGYHLASKSVQPHNDIKPG